ncbi:hypothetical protein J2750_000111 [Methanococcoides alaskense]|uniref:Uncharacterized protein n=1 Tax=Methanococcoides alaskense TaxID=325778 RepID=A0AA90TXR8_9EURY|nr:hypothetical protein [Methanococcoides alaskense]
MHIQQAYNTVNGKHYNYDINKNNYFVVNDSSKVNITTIVSEEINLSTELKISNKILPKYVDNVEMFHINLTNNITYEINIDYIEVHIDSDYEPVQLTMNRTYGQYSNTWDKNNSEFDSQIFTKGNSLFLWCPPIHQKQSTQFLVKLQKK